MTVAVFVAIYAGLAIFLFGCLLRAVEYARTPLHLRWELYPVPHEEASHAEHGGSYFESGAWWLSPQTFHHRRDLTAMFREIVFLRGLWEFNRRLWLPSFLFHFGLYLSIATIGLGTLTALPAALLAGAEASRLSADVSLLCRGTGYTGVFFVLIGAVLLLVRRLTDPALRNYTKAGDIFNLLFFIGAFALLAAGSLHHAADTASMGEIVRGAIRFSRGTHIGMIPGAGLIFASALAAYIPFTHMSHFVAKYFTWHSVRWDDRRNEKAGPMERKIAASLNYRPTWSAPHMGADGKRTWAEIAATNPAQETRK